jgi:hypothetical protein
MPKEKLSATFQETRREIVKLRNERLGRLQEQTDALNNAEANLKIAQNREQIAVTKDEDLKGKIRELTNHLNGLIDKPQVLRKVTRLGAEQLETYRERCSQEEIVRTRQRELTDAQTATICCTNGIAG